MPEPWYWADPYRLNMCYLRHDRAGKHLAYVKRALRRFGEGNPYPILPYEDEDALPHDPWEFMSRPDLNLMAGDYQITRDVRLNPVLSVRVGEMIYNLRSVLDYLIYALAWHDTGKRPTGRHERGLQFPIENTPEGFKGRRNSMLKGITDENVALIKLYQPCAGCSWTGTLRDISNADKHREVVVLAGAINTYEGEWYDSLDAIPEAVRERARLASPGQVDVGLYATLDVTFMNGLPVGQTLEQLHSEVWKVLYRLRREFKYRPVE
jgi:hypothetical protein